MCGVYVRVVCEVRILVIATGVVIVLLRVFTNRGRRFRMVFTVGVVGYHPQYSFLVNIINDLLGHRALGAPSWLVL